MSVAYRSADRRLQNRTINPSPTGAITCRGPTLPRHAEHRARTADLVYYRTNARHSRCVESSCGDQRLRSVI